MPTLSSLCRPRPLRRLISSHCAVKCPPRKTPIPLTAQTNWNSGFALVCSCIAVTCLVAAEAQARQTFLFNYDRLFDDDLGRTEGARLRITTESTRSTMNNFSGFFITSITGTHQGNRVTALMPVGFFDPILSGRPTDNLFNPLVGNPTPADQFSRNGFAYAAGETLFQFYFGEYELVSRPRLSPLDIDYREVPCITDSIVYGCRERARRSEITFVKTIPIPTPAPLPLLGVGAAYGYSRKLRKRIRPSRTTPSMTSSQRILL